MQYGQLYMSCVPFCLPSIHCAQVSLLVSDGLFVSMDVGVSKCNVWLLEIGWWWYTCNEFRCDGDPIVTGSIVT